MSGMTSPHVSPDPEAELRSYYATTDPGPAPSDFVHRVVADLTAADDRHAITFAVERVTRRGTTAGIGILVAACAVVAILAIGIALFAQRTPLPSPATGASPPVVSPSAAGSVTGHPSGFPTDPAAMAFFDAGHGLVVGEVNNQTAIWRTADSGGTWTLALLDTFRGTAVAVAGTHAWASGGSLGMRLGPGVFESTDEGVTWTKVASDELDSMSFVDDQHGFAIRTSSNETSVATSTDGGRTWTTTPVAAQPCGGLGASGPHPVGLSFISPAHGWVLCEAGFNPGGIEQRGVAETTDGGSTWQWVARVTPSGDPQVTTLETPDLPGGIVMRPGGTGFIWCLGGTLLRTEDGGATWSNVSSTPLTFTVQPWIIASAGTAGPWFAMRPANNPLALERSDDGGDTWSTVATGPLATIAPSPEASPAGQADPWWAWPTGVTTCGAPALYRIDGGQPARLGNCAAMLLAPPDSVVIRVGQELDLHMLAGAPAGASPAVPIYPLPPSPDDAVLRLIAQDDNGATGRYVAVAPGDLVLITTGSCLDTQSDQESNGACPVLHVTITP